MVELLKAPLAKEVNRLWNLDTATNLERAFPGRVCIDTAEDREGAQPGDEDIPLTCSECGRPTCYDYDPTIERYRHLVRPETGCFLIPPEPFADVYTITTAPDGWRYR